MHQYLHKALHEHFDFFYLGVIFRARSPADFYVVSLESDKKGQPDATVSIVLRIIRGRKTSQQFTGGYDQPLNAGVWAPLTVNDFGNRVLVTLGSRKLNNSLLLATHI